MTPPLDPLAQTLFNEGALARFLVDPDQGTFVAVNPAAERLCGRTARELMGTAAISLFQAKSAEGTQQLRHALAAATSAGDAEGFSLDAGDGSRIPVAVRAVRVEQHGQQTGRMILLTARDLRDELRTQALLAETQAELHRLIGSVSDFVWSAEVDENGYWAYRYYSPVIEKLTGRPPSFYQAGPEQWLSTVHRDDLARVQAVFEETNRGRLPHTEQEYRIIRPDGSVRWLRDSVMTTRCSDGRIILDGVVTDITERHQRETVLHEAHEGLRKLFHAAPVAIYTLDLDGVVRSWNPACERIYGWSETEVLGKPLPTVPVAHQDEVRAILQRIGGGKSFTGRPAERMRKDGRPVIISLSAVPLHDAQGQVEGLLAVVDDITDRKRAEEALARHHSLLRGLLNSIPDLIALKDIHGAYRGCNAAFERYVGRAESDILGRGDAELFPPAMGEVRQKSDRIALTERRLVRSEEWLEYPDGRRVLVDELKTPFFDAEGRLLGIIVIQRDITERRVLEEQLRQSQKMEAVGKLAGGVAHDFNNLLTVILGNVSLLQSGAADPAQTPELFSAIERAGWSAAELVRQLLGFSRQTVLRKQPTNLNQTVTEITGMLRRTIDPRIHVVVRSVADLWSVLADSSQMNQIVMNLCLNARDAMPEGGELAVETGNVTVREPKPSAAASGALAPGDYVRLRVADSGVGIPVDVRPRIFDPFFTTKAFGKGSGLGLALVFGIVQQHDGWIECHSEPGQGTRFDVYFPRLSQAASDGPVLCAPALADGRTATVLLVDDEQMIRELGQTWLQRLGYRVVLAADGKQAVEVFERERDRIDLVILDIIMPEMSGRDVFRRIRQIDDRVPVLFSSGFSNEPIRPSEEDGIVAFIAKPYQVDDLARAVRNALEAAGRVGTIRNGE